MENKVVCYYCGTIYNEENEKCPLCGGKVRTAAAQSPQPVRRERITDQQRRERQRAAAGKGRYAGSRSTKQQPQKTSNDNTRTILIAALIFLALAVVVVTWFIGDMIGWWGGIEDSVDRPTTTSSVVSGECTALKLSKNEIHLENIGDTATLEVSVNIDCTEKIALSYPDAAIVTAESKGDSVIGDELKTDAWTLTAVSEGTSEFTFSCGELTATCTIRVGQAAPDDTTAPTESEEPTETETIPNDFEPELNFPSDVSLYQRGETVPLRVTNLPAGAEVTWTSSDETVAKVDKNGVVTAIKGGSAVIVADVGGKTAEVLVRCPFSESGDIGAHLYYTDVTIAVGESYNLYLLDINGNRITDVQYTVSKEGICSIDDGKVTGVSSGTTTVTVTYNTVEYECIVRVK